MKVVEIIGNKNKILEYGALCCNCEINEGVVEGEPTEVAIVKEAVKEKQNKILPRICEIPFDSNRKLMTTVNELENGKYRIITKGAPEILLGICDYYEENNTVHDMNSTFLSKIKNKNENGRKGVKSIRSCIFRCRYNAKRNIGRFFRKRTNF